MSLNGILAVAAGGALGAVLRYLAMVSIGTHNFPYGTLAVNIVGSFVLACLIEVFALVWQPPQEVKLFLVVGMLGAFTTFSTFSLDTVTLFERGDLKLVFVYVISSVILSVSAFFGGLMLFRYFLK